MTIINRISIHGFKSFAHKTDVPLDGKYNCILGPNGSGKSNVGDALCFVLGRLSAKSMR
ncbi:MAG: AAA family ATPase, partial [Nanoarchaeota archaeon]|nr:AAA family ATPase [Nanoarchaeota archaeon]